MKRFFLLPLAILLTGLVSCQKQSDADRQAEIDREVQRRLDAEQTVKEREDLARREGELNAREQTLSQPQPSPEQRNVGTVEAERSTRERETTRERESTRERSSAQPSGGSYGLFYTKLESQGDWLESNDYGYVWRPRVARESRNWRPYVDGRWVYTDAGWTWVSEESFGWATYHYGRWTRLRNVGWVWVPGDEWAPAWVSWRKSDEYVGWAPLPPEARFDRHAGIHNWADSYYDIGPENYSFVPSNQLGTRRLVTIVVPVDRNLTIVNQTTNVTNITYNNTTVVNQGPNYEELRSRSQQPIERLRLEREVNINIGTGEPRAVVRGEVISVPAPMIERGQAVAPPPSVKERITAGVVEHGWEGISDRRAVEQARVKIQSEATPPPNPPSKIFVRPMAAVAPAATASASANANPAEKATRLTSSSSGPAPSASASGTAAETSATPVRSNRFTPAPSASTTPAPGSTASVSATRSATTPRAAAATPSPSVSATAREIPTPRPTSSATPRALTSTTPRPVSSPTASANSSPSPSATANASPAPSGSAGANSASTARPHFGNVRSMRKMAEDNQKATGQPFPGVSVVPDSDDKTKLPQGESQAGTPPSLPPTQKLPARGRALQAEPRLNKTMALPSVTPPSPSVTPPPASSSTPTTAPSASTAITERPAQFRRPQGLNQPGEGSEQKPGAKGPRGRNAIPSPSPSASPSPSPAG
jgi:hypothetical protein